MTFELNHESSRFTLGMDAHVHIYAPNQCIPALNAAATNMAKLRSHTGAPLSYGVLLLADPSHAPAFEWLAELADQESQTHDGWCLRHQHETGTLFCEHPDHIPLIVIAGQQLVTSERLEALVFPKIYRDYDELPLDRVCADALAHDALAIIPWGAGKWLGRRGRILSQTLRQLPPGRIGVGDNGGRASRFGNVAQLEYARHAGFARLDGTDPLPLNGELERIGTYGVCADVSVNPKDGAPAILRAFLNNPHSTIGRRVGFWRFVSNQIRLRLPR